MSNNTAVDWLIREIRNHVIMDSLDAITISKLKMQAKAMEREQIMEAYGAGHNDGCAYMYDGNQEFVNCEKYYNETYKGGNNE